MAAMATIQLETAFCSLCLEELQRLEEIRGDPESGHLQLQTKQFKELVRYTQAQFGKMCFFHAHFHYAADEQEGGRGGGIKKCGATREL